MHGFDTFAVTPRRLGDLRRPLRPLRLPRRQEPAEPARRRRVDAGRRTCASTRSSRCRALAPGAEEFMPPADTGIWLPPQRTFSVGRSTAARSWPSARMHVEAGIERDIARRDDRVRARVQPAGRQPARHALRLDARPPPHARTLLRRRTAARVEANGYAAGVKTVIAERVHGSVEYSFARAERNPLDDARVSRAVRADAAPDRSTSGCTTSRRRSKPTCRKRPRASPCSAG